MPFFLNVIVRILLVSMIRLVLSMQDSGGQKESIRTVPICDLIYLDCTKSKISLELDKFTLFDRSLGNCGRKIFLRTMNFAKSVCKIWWLVENKFKLISNTQQWKQYGRLYISVLVSMVARSFIIKNVYKKINNINIKFWNHNSFYIETSAMVDIVPVG